MTQEELLKLSWCPEGCASFLEWVPYRSNAQTGLILIAHAVNENFEHEWTESPDVLRGGRWDRSRTGGRGVSVRCGQRGRGPICVVPRSCQRGKRSWRNPPDTLARRGNTPPDRTVPASTTPHADAPSALVMVETTQPDTRSAQPLQSSRPDPITVIAVLGRGTFRATAQPPLSPAPLPSAVDPHTVERAWFPASRWSAPLYECGLRLPRHSRTGGCHVEVTALGGPRYG